MNPKWPPLASSRFGPSTAAPPAQWKERRFSTPNCVRSLVWPGEPPTSGQLPDCRQTGSYGCSCPVDAGVGGGGYWTNGTVSKKKGGMVECSRIAPKRIQGHPLAPVGIGRHSFFMGIIEISCDAVT